MHNSGNPQKKCHRLHITMAAIVIMAVTSCVLVMPVTAHSPAAMVVSFDPSHNILSVTITHLVDDPTTHYLNKVQVRLNDSVVSDPPYTSQPTKDTFTYTYNLTPLAGDEVRIIASCVQGGSLEKTYVPLREGTPVQTRIPATVPLSAPPTTKAAAGLLSLIGAAAVILIRK